MHLLLAEAETFGVGKTTLLGACREQLVRQKFRVGGLLCPAVYAYRAGHVVWVGHDAILLPSGKRIELTRVGKSGWEPRHVFFEHTRSHPHLTAARRDLRANPAGVGQCLTHLEDVLSDSSVDALVVDEIGTILAGDTPQQVDGRLLAFCQGLANSGKDVVVAAFQLRVQRKPHVLACMDALRDAGRRGTIESLVLDGLVSSPDLPADLLEQAPTSRD